jgi:hypothetical protein
MTRAHPGRTPPKLETTALAQNPRARHTARMMMQDGDTTAGSAEQEPDDVRFSASGDVEVFDGTAWQPYRELPSDDTGTLMRDDPDAVQAIPDDDE